MLFRHAVLLVSGLLAASLAAAQDRPKPPPPEMVWAGQPVKETPYTGPNRPIWRLSELSWPPIRAGQAGPRLWR